MYRKDYYKFANELMPNKVFNNGRLMVYRLLRNEEQFIQELKSTWPTIDLENPQFRSAEPDFKMEIVQADFEHTAIIISMPEASLPQEAINIAIVYDNDDNFRYFTYEINYGIEDRTQYSLNEICSNGEKIDYGIHDGMKDFKDRLAEILFYDLL
ncbi:MAG: hypothetical protein ABRQ25_08380 [Clostridiaceae bacterium]